MNAGDEKVFAEQREAFGRISALIDEARTIAICAHTDPDGDALGSGLALAQVIRQRWPQKQVTNLLADDDPVPRLYRFMPGANEFVRSSEYEGSPDLFISVDLPIIQRLNNGKDVLERAAKVVVIDHHPSSAPFGDVSLVRPDAAATGVIIAELALYLGVEITPDIANCLFCAIVTDTGRFQYQNADSEAFECASMLVDAGASPSLISLNVYQSFRLAYLHLESVVMGRIVTFDRGRISYSYATRADLERTGALPDECDGLIDVVRSVEGSEVALFLKELPDGRVRGNLRSKGAWDISSVARAMGGGGHKAAAGFTVEVGIDAALAKALPQLQAVLDAPEDPSSEAVG
ncbi:DHH family phosphoesterase [Olsenella uli]|uniref:DHH family phosphoesterase n=1 Tax=Olsenella uli TaxID=133926 RepID=UPI0012ABFF33|nr:bifunctional oligoribonuclease/PAP phosphatase NrnA [Olsenella uli]